MLFPPAPSRYGGLFAAVFCTVFALLFLVLWAIALCLQRRLFSPRLRIAVVVLYTVGALSQIFSWALLQSAQIVPFYASALLSLPVPMLPACIVLTLLLSEKWANLMFARAKAKRSEGEELDTRSVTSQDVPPVSQVETPNDKADNEPTGDECGGTVEYDARPPLAVYVSALKEERKISAGLFGGFLFFVFFFTIMTYGGCYCGKPDIFTTWAARKPFCSKDEVCHAYFMPGQNCTQMDAVAHYVGSTPSSYSVKVCAGASSACSATNVVGASVRVRLHTPVQVPQDNRFMIHARAYGLQGDTIYTFVFEIAGKTATRTVRTFPCVLDAPVDYIAGGDFYSGDIGSNLLQQAHNNLGGNERFIYIGGDVTYSNNMRFCFPRVDQFIDRITRLKRSADGTSIPILVAVGNHEGGGYLNFKDKTAREDGFYFHNDYFPSFGEGDDFYQSNDRTSTFHSHIIGSTAWIILDSSIIFPVTDQIGWLNATLSRWVSRIQAGELRDIMVSYHNPAWPSVRPDSNTQAVDVRENVVPVIDRYWPHVPLVLEHHDHAYKRTHPLRDGLIRSSANATARPNGVVYVGDGSWGVSDPLRSVSDRWYTTKTMKGNYILAIRHLNATANTLGNVARVVTLDENGFVKDDFVV